MSKGFPFLLLFVFLFSWQSLAQDDLTPQVTTLAEGLYNPVGLALLPNGNLLIAEEGTGKDDLSAGVSMRLPDGTIGRLISEFPSSRDSGDLSGIPLVSVSPDGSTIYVGNFNATHLWTLPASLAETLPETPFTPDDMGVAMERFNNVFLANPFDMTYAADGTPIVSDATGNGVAIELDNGTTRFFHRFDAIPNPANDEMTIQAVPTGITRVDDEYYVALFGGCPYPANSGQIVAIDENRNQRTVLNNLNMPIDVALADDGRVWVLEFAKFTPDGSCFSGMGYRSETGRLSYIHNGERVPVLENLDFPGSVLPLSDGSLYISQVFTGELLHVQFGEQSAEATNNPIPAISPAEPTYTRIEDYDVALAQTIAAHDLTANPGQTIDPPDPVLADLGQDLFFDPILSGDMNISCATCHHPTLAMGDARVLPLGTGGVGLSETRSYLDHINISDDYRGNESGEVSNPFVGELVPRNSPTIINSALLPSMFWDGRVESYALGQPVLTQDNEVNRLNLTDVLVAQALFPVTSTAEMGGVTFGNEAPQHIREQIAMRLMNNPDYRARFGETLGIDNIEPIHIVTALAAFEQEMIFTESPWDSYLMGDTSALTEQQKRGALLFFGELNPDVNCAACHSGDLFTDMQFHNLLVPQIGPGKGNGVTGREDFGRANVTFDHRDQYTFRTPSLRNVSLTAPYFHSGAYATLEATIWHHANMVESATQYDPASHIPPAYFSSVLPFNWERQGHSAAPQLMGGLPLTEQDVADLVAYMDALTDPEATDLSDFLLDEVPSGLPLDPIPTPNAAITQVNTQTVAPEDIEEAVTGSEWMFADIAEEVGIGFTHGAFATDLFGDPAAMMGGGLCWIDYDKNGWLDLYLVNSYAEDEAEYWEGNGGLPQNALYRNDGGVFTDVSQSTQSNLSMRGNGCVVADFNNDTWDDIFITADGENALLLNRGDGTFREVAAQSGLNTPEWNSAAAVADLNGDGWLDLFVGSYIDLNNPVPNPIGAFPQDYYGIPDRLYLSNGVNGDDVPTFTEVTRDAGLAIDERTLGAIFSDFDADGDLDLYLANDGQPNRLYEYRLADNALGFTLIDTYETSGVNDRGSGMGVASGDWTGDGWFDLMVTNWDTELNAIYRNETNEAGDLSFVYSTYRIGMVGLGNNMTGWGVHFADFDHDTDLDLLTVNGRVPVANPATDAELVRLYGNRLVEGHPGQFREWTSTVGLNDIGPLMARGSALADFDNDGDLDIAINTISGDALLLRNQSPTGNWLMIDLGAVIPGTYIEVQLADGTMLKREVYIGSSYLASEDPRIHFGLGSHQAIEQLVIHYPNGEHSIYSDIHANQVFQPD
jgi:cytochrome c peroxidase